MTGKSPWAVDVEAVVDDDDDDVVEVSIVSSGEAKAGTEVQPAQPANQPTSRARGKGSISKHVRHAASGTDTFCFALERRACAFLIGNPCSLCVCSRRRVSKS